MAGQPDSFIPKPLIYPEWECEYREALLELDSKRVQERVRIAEAAIQKRSEAIAADQNYAMEQQAIEDALANLHGLIRLQEEKPRMAA